jgi:hypothetical protein
VSYPLKSFLLTILGACKLGKSIMTQYLMEMNIRHTLSRLIFLTSFSCSLSLLSMYLLEIMRFKISHSYWYFVLITLVAMCQLVISIGLNFSLPFAETGGILMPVVGIFLSGVYCNSYK